MVSTTTVGAFFVKGRVTAFCVTIAASIAFELCAKGILIDGG